MSVVVRGAPGAAALRPTQLRRARTAAGRRPATCMRGRSALSTWPAGRSRAATSFLPIFVAGLDLARVHAASRRRRARRGSAAGRGPSCAGPAARARSAWSVPFIARLSVKCFSTIRAPEHVRGDGHRDAVVVAREPDDRVRELLAVGLDHAQVELVPLRRVAGRALQDRHLRVDRARSCRRRAGRRRAWRRRCETIIGLPISAT